MVSGGSRMTATRIKIGKQIDEIHLEMLDHMGKHERVKAGDLAKLIGMSIPSIRVRLLELMALGMVGREKTRDHQVWFFLKN